MDWASTLRECNAHWKHDGNPKRPYVRLTSGLISNEFYDMSYVMAVPELVDLAANELASRLRSIIRGNRPAILCGQMKGSVTLASHIATKSKMSFIFTNKIGEGADKKMEVDERFVGICNEEQEEIYAVEDVVTSASTSVLSCKAAREFGFKHVADETLCIVNRSGKSEINGMKIISCYEAPDVVSWKEGFNPFTPNGEELVEPVRAKTRDGRIAMHLPM
mgnify:CR=1 FL=1